MFTSWAFGQLAGGGDRIPVLATVMEKDLFFGFHGLKGHVIGGIIGGIVRRAAGRNKTV